MVKPEAAMLYVYIIGLSPNSDLVKGKVEQDPADLSSPIAH